MSDAIKKHFQEALEVLTQFANDEASMNKVKEAGDLMVQSLRNGGKIVSCGNGGSICRRTHWSLSR